MSDLLKKIERDARKLTPQQRIILADRLMSPFNEGTELEDVEMKWLEKTENHEFKCQSQQGEGISSPDAFGKDEKFL